jgi:NitT/TauT family transport system substrate-binding protein
VSDPIRIQFTRFSAFYSPLIVTMAGGFLKSEGFAPRHSIAPAGRSAIEGVAPGTVDVCQSAPSQGFGPLEKGQAPPALHFAQINEKDGFFLTGLDYAAIKALNVPSDRMDQAFRKGEGDYIHQQGPAPQQLEHDGVGHVVASVGEHARLITRRHRYEDVVAPPPDAG